MKAEEKLILIRTILNNYYECVDTEAGYKAGIIDAICCVACYEEKDVIAYDFIENKEEER